MRIGVVVGEASGDTLGAGLMQELQAIYPQAEFVGIGGPKMLALGFQSLFPQDRLAVMGLVEPLKRLPELLSIRKSLKQYFISQPPAVFIGIDAPDFNLSLERSLRSAGIKTAHYVSPSVWAWRQGRVKTIAKAVDLMLTLFPFEKKFYSDHQVHAEFVGHPLADQIPLHPDMSGARSRLLMEPLADTPVVALLPGSRAGEVERMAPIFLEAARHCAQKLPGSVFLIPAASPKRKQQLTEILKDFSDLNLRLFDGQSQDVMAAADALLIASGTTTLEALLLKKPMVIAYKVAPLTFWILSRLVKVKSIGLPNLLAQKELVSEYIQEAAQPRALADRLVELLCDSSERSELERAYLDIHTALKQNASAKAAKAIAHLIGNL